VHAVRRAGVVAALAAAVLAGSAQLAAAGSGSGNGGGGQCTVDLGGTWITVACGYGSGSPGGGGGGGGGGGTKIQNNCTFVPVDEAYAKQLGLQWPPPKGESWALMRCFGRVSNGLQAVLVNTATGVPQISPQQLLQEALSELQIPVLHAGTAPPPGKDGLVGLPEWFWVPAAGWRQRSVTVTAGPVWATAMATPVGLSFQPGGGLAPVGCRGPGTAYDSRRPASGQRTSCSYRYEQSSVDQPGHAYQASIVVTWRVSWIGSGGAGGVLNAGLPVTFSFALPVAQGEALVSNP
jgi:hypothetical protein